MIKGQGNRWHTPCGVRVAWHRPGLLQVWEGLPQWTLGTRGSLQSASSQIQPPCGKLAKFLLKRYHQSSVLWWTSLMYIGFVKQPKTLTTGEKKEGNQKHCVSQTLPHQEDNRFPWEAIFMFHEATWGHTVKVILSKESIQPPASSCAPQVGFPGLADERNIWKNDRRNVLQGVCRPQCINGGISFEPSGCSHWFPSDDLLRGHAKMVLLPEEGFLIFGKPHRNLSVPSSTLYCSNLGMGNLTGGLFGSLVWW